MARRSPRRRYMVVTEVLARSASEAISIASRKRPTEVLVKKRRNVEENIEAIGFTIDGPEDDEDYDDE